MTHAWLQAPSLALLSRAFFPEQDTASLLPFLSLDTKGPLREYICDPWSVAPRQQGHYTHVLEVKLKYIMVHEPFEVLTVRESPPVSMLYAPEPKFVFIEDFFWDDLLFELLGNS